MKKRFSAFVIFTLLFSLVVPFMTSAAPASNWDFARYGDVIDIGTQLRALETDEEYRVLLDQSIKAQASELNFNEVSAQSSSTENSSFTFDGGTKYFLAYNNGGYYFKTFTLRSIGENVEIWVANNLTFPAGDPRPPHVVTQEQVDKLRDEFDNNIYPKEIDFFGTPDSHTGDNSLLTSWGYFPEGYYTSSDGVERTIMLVDNIRDESYYNPSYPFFIAGFYSSAFEAYIDRNIISIDTNSWATRLENTFFGTVAHEYQHLIHDDNDSLEETWINEGMSDFAEYLVGYGHPMGHVNFFLDHPENSLVEWDEHYSAPTGPETLADYGQAYLLQLYLNDKFGKAFIRALAKDTDHGIASVEKILEQFDAGINFEELFRRFTIAVAIDSGSPGNGIYQFDSINLKVNYDSARAFNKEGVPAWGADYLVVEDAKKINDITFDGIDFMPNPWKVVNDPLGSDNQVLWGNTGNEIDNHLILEVDLSEVGAATLQFDNYIQIEEHWDFGLVQVSTDGGNTWTSLSNENTTSDIVPEGYPAIKDNLPGFTGYYEDWTTEYFDLSEYAGQNILLSFRYMTDWGYNDPGWYIDNISIPEIGFFADGSSIADFKSIDQLKQIYVDYAVTFINEKSLGKGNNQQHYQVLNIDPFNVTEADAIQLKEFFSGGKNYMVIWYTAPVGKKGSVDYTYEIRNKNEAIKNK